MSVLDDVKSDRMAKVLFFMGILPHFKLLGQLAIRIYIIVKNFVS
jgi:hypothetical protein